MEDIKRKEKTSEKILESTSSIITMKKQGMKLKVHKRFILAHKWITFR